MAVSSTKPQAWTLSPQMTAAPELWRGCTLMLPFWDSFPDARNITPHGPRIVSQAINTSGSIDRNIGPNGVRAFANNGNDAGSGAYYDFNAGDFLLDSTDVTLFAVVQVDQLSSNRSNAGDQVVWGWGSGDVEYAPYFNDNDQIQLWDGQGTAQGSTSFAAGVYYVIHTVFDNSATEFSLYIDGAFDNTLGRFGTMGPSGSVRLFNNHNASPNRSFEGRCDIAAAWNRKLSNEEIVILSDDPFAMLRPAGF
jgi:hypothetical protein